VSGCSLWPEVAPEGSNVKEDRLLVDLTERELDLGESERFLIEEGYLTGIGACSNDLVTSVVSQGELINKRLSTQ
jgi:hypothetical protein